jgi:hypothetical protein
MFAVIMWFILTWKTNIVLLLVRQDYLLGEEKVTNMDYHKMAETGTARDMSRHMTPIY